MFNLEHKTVQTRSKNHVVNLYTGVTEYLYLCCCISNILLLYLYFAQVWPPLAALPSRPLGRDGSTNLSAFLPGSCPPCLPCAPCPPPPPLLVQLLLHCPGLAMTNGPTPKHSESPKPKPLQCLQSLFSLPHPRTLFCSHRMEDSRPSTLRKVSKMNNQNFC